MISGSLLKEKLHEFIDTADDEVIEALCVLLKNEIKELRNPLKQHFEGESKFYDEKEN